MSYSNEIKREILNNEINDKREIYAELFGIFFSKQYILNNEIRYFTESITLAKRVYSNLRKIIDINIQIKCILNKRQGSYRVFEIIIKPLKKEEKLYKEFMEKLKIYFDKKIIVDENEEISAIIRGFFLNSGYIKTPEKGYALDFFLDNDSGSNYLYTLLKKMKKKVFKSDKKDKKIIYLRNSEDILDIIYIIGGVNSFFGFEEVTINKEIRNKINRTMNWEIANEAKKITTSEKHLTMIYEINEKIGLDKLTEALKETAQIRLENEEASLEELANIAGISKSGIRNRFRRIEEIYINLKNENGE